MSEIKSVCVYCSTRFGDKKEFAEAARELGRTIAKEKLNFVYGGSNVGLMGETANAVLKNGGTATGIIPRVLIDKEAPHEDLTEIFLVDDMHTRKKMMFDKADAFIVMPGGFGTMDETFEVITWKFIGTNKKPIVIVNIEDYYVPLLKMIDNMIGHDLASPEYRKFFTVVNKVEDVIPTIRKLAEQQ